MTASSRSGFTGYQIFVVAVLAFLQFSLVLDFMILSPLGAILMPVMHITPAQFGLVVSTYAFSAGVAGVLTAGFADRFDRKKLLLLFYAGFIAGTLLCGLASSYHFLLFARLITGLFSGLVGSVSFAIITDLFPLKMRGRVMGIIQTAFAASAVLGIPVSLLLATHFGWNAPFFLIVAVCAAVGCLIGVYLRPVDEHLDQHPERSAFHHLIHTLSNRHYLQGFATTALLGIGGFLLMPFMSAFTVFNVGLPLEKLPLLYIMVGACSAGAGPLIGMACDAFGKYKVFAFGCAVTMAMVVIYTHLGPTPFWTLVIVLAALQVGIFSRMISGSALMSALPSASDRGAYMSISSSLQQLAGGIAAIISGLIVVQNDSGPLQHFDVIGYVLVCTTLVSLATLYFINRTIEGNESASNRVPEAVALSE